MVTQKMITWCSES